MKYSFHELSIFFWLIQEEMFCLKFISHHLKEIFYVYSYSKGDKWWNKKRDVFSSVSMLKLKNSVFYVELKEALSTIFNFPTAQIMKLSIVDFFSKCDQIRNLLRIWSHLLKKPLMEILIFCVVFWVLNAHFFKTEDI